jgi:D-alanyl-lipoteichoic acid acyltransferase DltB (MBOAT superfamily)
MSLNSYPFVFIFLPAAVSLFWLIARRHGNPGAFVWLIACSLAFYAYSSFISLAIILPSIAVDYALAKAMLRHDADDGHRRRLLFIVGIVANVGLLGYLKYRVFIVENLGGLFGMNSVADRLVVPIGLSFIVFQKISFLSDVWSRQIRSVSLPSFLLFTIFFPRVIAGPVVRYGEIAPQFASLEVRRAGENVAIGLALFAIGLFKKSVLSDGVARLAPIDFEGAPSLFHAWIAMLAYTLQVYFDFAGYSDMALGAARMFGIKLPMNFNSPLKASSIIEFWARWHISLTRFLTDYIYTPLVMRVTRARLRRGKPVLRAERVTLGAIATLVALPTFVTLILSGLWHGAGWSFVAWGVLHAVYLTANQTWRLLRPGIWRDRRSYDRIMQPLGFGMTFLGVVIALVFFRAPSISSALGVVQGMLGMNGLLYPHAVLEKWGQQVDLVQLYVIPTAWVLGLLLIATLLPNSLEILRRFSPALDAPQDTKDPRSVGGGTSTGPRDLGAAHIGGAPWRSLRDLVGYRGLPLDRYAAVVVAALCVWGVASLGRAAPFFYAQF